MGFTNHTPNYNLPQYVSTDVPSYLVDQNNAWSAVDSAIKNVSDVANRADGTANTAVETGAQALSIAEANTTKVNGALADFADAFSTTKTYEVGDFCIYNNVLYKCKQAVTVAGSFSGADWDATTVGEEMNRLKLANDGVKVTNGHDLISSSFSSYNNVRLRERNGSVYGMMDVTIGTRIPAWSQIGDNLPSNFRAGDNRNFLVNVYNVTDRVYMGGYGIVASNGAFSMSAELAQGKRYWFEIKYVV